MVVGAPGRNAQAAPYESRGKALRVGHDLLCVDLELGRRRLAQGDGHRRDGVVVRPAPQRGEHGGVHSPLVRQAIEDEPRPWPAQRLVRRAGDDIGVLEGGGRHAPRHEPRHVRHVRHEQ